MISASVHPQTNIIIGSNVAVSDGNLLDEVIYMRDYEDDNDNESNDNNATNRDR